MDNDTVKLIERIKKLFSLSQNNPNEHEAESAIEKAQRLMDEYNISLMDVEGHETRARIISVGHVYKPSERLDTWRHYLGEILSKAFSCSCIAGTAVGKKGLHFYGTPETLNVLMNIYDYLESQLEVFSAVCTYERDNKRINARTYRNSWLIGAVRTLKDRLNLAYAKNSDTHEHNALILMRDIVDERMRQDFPRTTNVGFSSNLNTSAYNDGRKDANALDIGQSKLRNTAASDRKQLN